MQELIQIRAASKRNVLVSLLLGIFGLFVSFTLVTLFPEKFRLLSVFLTGASLVALLIAWSKFREPAFSVELSKEYIRYQHRHGYWLLDWSNVQRIDVPKVQKGLQHKNLGMVGIRVKNYDPLLENISPRLMSNILMEQRPLLLHSQADARLSDTSYGDSLLEHDRYKGENGKVLNGIHAMFANRMNKLRRSLGYDLFISVAELDRSEQDFVQLLKQCHSQVTNQVKSELH
jgi:hypothetical protein